MNNQQEILFRGFYPCDDGDTTIVVEDKEVVGRWIYGGYWLNDTITRQTYNIIEYDGDTINVIPSTVGQYIGKEDKNGVKIFTDDIVSFDDRIGTVTFGEYDSLETYEKTHIGYYITWADNTISCLRKDIGYWLSEYSCEVIGNIFDKPKGEHTK